MGSRSSVTEKQNASFPFVWNGAVPTVKAVQPRLIFPHTMKACYLISDYS